MGALYNPVEHRMRRLDELPVEVATALEAVEVDKDGTIKKAKFWNKLEALRLLAKT